MSNGGESTTENSSSYPPASEYWVNEDEYGGSFSADLVEQYKSYILMATRTSDRRVRINRFYVSVLSALFVLVSLIPKLSGGTTVSRTIIFAVLVFGVLLCIVWFFNIESYSQLNKQKYHIAHEVEEKLPYSFYKAEWESEELAEGNEYTQYIPHARLEQAVPVIIAFPYLIVLGQVSLNYIPTGGLIRGISLGVIILLVIIVFRIR